MSGRRSTPHERQKKGGSIFPALCSVAGTVIILAVIALLLPLSVPRLLGYEVYDIVSGSMEPTIPTGSMVFVKPVGWEEIGEGDVIAYRTDGGVVTHRVAEKRTFLGEFVTKGDANESEDFLSVPFDMLVGRVERHIPFLGNWMAYLASALGKIYLFALLVCGVLFHVLANRLREAY